LESSLAPNGEFSDRALTLASWNSKFETGTRSPLDAAILRRAPTPSQPGVKIDEAPFDFQRRRVSVVVGFKKQRLLITKGTPESVLATCTAFEAEGDAESCGTVYENLSRQGKRVLAVAYKTVADQPAYTATDEHSLTFVDFLVFTDPVLPDTASAIADLQRDGVTVKLVTGDTALVAHSLCRKVGLDGSRIITGPDTDQMTVGALSYAVENNTVFARINPAQKTRIVLALKNRGHVVGFIGDGINDAPSLRVADVGISVATATDIAREAADIVLTKPSLRVLYAGLLEGRRAYGNILKYLLMSTSSNFGNMFSMAVASVVLPFLPMLPTQLLLNKFLYDVAQITIPTDNVDVELLRAPHRWDIQMIRNFMIGMGPVSSLFDFLTLFVLFRLLQADERLFHTGCFVESLVTQVAVLLVMRTLGNPLRSRPSRALLASTLAIVGSAVLLPYTGLAPWLGVCSSAGFVSSLRRRRSCELSCFGRVRQACSRGVEVSAGERPHSACCNRMITLLLEGHIQEFGKSLASAVRRREPSTCMRLYIVHRAIRRSTKPYGSGAATWNTIANVLRGAGRQSDCNTSCGT
jgi:P-type Mg2+ transporter